MQDYRDLEDGFISATAGEARDLITDSIATYIVNHYPKEPKDMQTVVYLAYMFAGYSLAMEARGRASIRNVITDELERQKKNSNVKKIIDAVHQANRDSGINGMIQ